MKRLEGLAKLTGTERYVDDLPLQGCLWGMTARSPVPRGRITGITYGGGVDWNEVVVVDHRDVPGPNVVALIEDDQPILAADRVEHVHEPVVLVAHESRELARRAVAAITIDVEREEPVLDGRASTDVIKELLIDKGDVEAALASAPHVVEGTYETGAQEHVYLENQGMAAWLEGEVLVVTGSMQCPYYVLNALMPALERDEKRLRVVHAPTGGGFGGKEEYPSILALHTALLALKAQRPVKMIYDRGEDMAATTKRHPSRITIRTGLDDEGRLLAQDIDVTLDGGAYVTLSPVVLSRGIIHAAGPYACDHVRVRGRAVRTNNNPYGAFRGFGAPQTLFATERHMDVVARRLGHDPIELRRRNLIRDGQTTSTGQLIDDGVDRVAVLDRALDAAGFESRRAAHRTFNGTHPFLRRGIGVAAFLHGAGFTGSGEVHLASRLRVAGLSDGRVEVLSASTEMGQGTTTLFTQIAAARLGFDPDDVVIAEPDTQRVPDSGPTVASRTIMVVGQLVERACDALREQLGLDAGATGRKVKGAIATWHRDHPRRPLVAEVAYEKPPEIEWSDETYRGSAYAAYAWATYVAEVEVDLRTYETTVTDFVAAQEIGKVLNPTLAAGQVQGGVVQGIGWALTEECICEHGAMVNNQLTNYIIPTCADVPPIRVVFMETPYPRGPQGAKGLGELPIDGPAPAILNAVADAVGADPTAIPLTPERLMRLVP